MKNKHVLISGAGIAGAALAYWLQRYGFEVTIIESAPKIRTGGYKIDLRGKAVEVVKKMGLYEKIRELRIVMLSGTILDEKGKVIDKIAGEYMGMHVGDDIELWREDLNRVLYDVTFKSCEYLFNQSVKSLKWNHNQITAEFLSGQSRQFDILVGADGIHSNVRSLVFGQESLFSHNLGDYFVAVCTAKTSLNLNHEEIFYCKTDKLFNIYGTKPEKEAKQLFVFRAQGLTYEPKNVKRQKEIVSDIYSDGEWEIPNMIKAMNRSSDFYFDEVKQIRMKKWFKNRAVLIGDAGFSPSLASGQGTSLAFVSAYVLAGELMLAKGDHKIAFPEFEKEIRPFVYSNQKIGELIIEHMVPKDKVKPWIDNSMLHHIQFGANNIHLKNYPDPIQ